jgi:hypothetical protein
VLKSILPEHCRIDTLEASTRGDVMMATIDGLVPDEIATVVSEFRDESGLTLDLKGQMAFF